jgi:ABC-type maltose transport system permease subunit
MTVTSFKGEDQMRSLTSMFLAGPAALENYLQKYMVEGLTAGSVKG